MGHLDPLRTGLPVAPTLAAALVHRLGGRYSAEMGIDLDGGDAEVERWFLASTLFGARISATVAERTFAVLERSGIHCIADTATHPCSALVALLDAGGYARYDFRTAARLQTLAREVAARYGAVTAIGRRFADPVDLAAALDDLPGWGPVTVALFLRELRGVWPGACPPLDRRAAQAGRHLGLLRGEGPDELGRLVVVAGVSSCDVRDLEAALVRLSLAHSRSGPCPGGRGCVALAPPAARPATMRRVTLPGRRTVTIRPMRPTDWPGLATLYSDLAPEDVYRRFFTVRPPPRSFVVKMAALAQCGGSGLVATVRTPGQSDGERMVAEATYSPLTSGDAELGITVARDARGWLGPYLFDALLEDAAAHGVPNLQADVLLTNAPMLTMLRRRGYAVIGFEDQPALVRVVVGSVGKVPSWPGAGAAPRVLVETPGGRWHADTAARRAGFEVMACPSPPGGWTACPAQRGEPCPLAADADVIVSAVPGAVGRTLLDAHRRTHPNVPLCAEVPAGDPDPGPVAARITRGAAGSAVVAVLERVARPLWRVPSPAPRSAHRAQALHPSRGDLFPCRTPADRHTMAP